ncbi:MAG TPA: hypothetical protein VGN51_22345 [Acidimicrobiia bacterium]
MLHRVLILMGAIAMAGAVSAPHAGAAPPNRATITIACDRGTSHASAVVTLFDGTARSQASTPTTLDCGTDVGAGKSDRIVVPTGFVVAYASIDGYQVTTGSDTVSCAGDGTLALKLACTDSTGTGASVTVR